MDMGEMGKYQFLYDGDVMIGAVMPKMPQMPVSLWSFYIGVDDIDRAAEAIGGGGGTDPDGTDGDPGRRIFGQRARPAGRRLRPGRPAQLLRRRSMTRQDDHLPVVRQRRGAQGRRILRERPFPTARSAARCARPDDFPGGSEGDELTVDFTVLGRAFVGLNGGPDFKPNEAVSFMVITEDQEETDRYWNAIVGNGGAGKRVRLVQGPLGLLLADHAARSDRGDHQRRHGASPSARSRR